MSSAKLTSLELGEMPLSMSIIIIKNSNNGYFSMSIYKDIGEELSVPLHPSPCLSFGIAAHPNLAYSYTTIRRAMWSTQKPRRTEKMLIILHDHYISLPMKWYLIKINFSMYSHEKAYTLAAALSALVVWVPITNTNIPVEYR